MLWEEAAQSETWGRRDAGTEGRGEEGTRGRRDVGTQGHGDGGTQGRRHAGTRGWVNIITQQHQDQLHHNNHNTHY